MNDHETTTMLERLAGTFPDQPAPLASLVAAAHAARRLRNRRNATLVVASVLLTAGAGVALGEVVPDRDAHSADHIADSGPAATCDRNHPSPPSSPVPQGPDYPTNPSGLTYGGHSDSGMPDLVATIGECGRTGYTYTDDHGELPPWVPGAGGDAPREIPVYESDGTTQIDTFVQSPGVAARSAPPGSTPDGPSADDLQGEWTALIVGGSEPYDTFRDLDLSVAFVGDEVRVLDGCRTWGAEFTLENGSFTLTGPFAADSGGECARAAPLPRVLANVRHVTESGKRTYLHLENFRIAVVLTPTG